MRGKLCQAASLFSRAGNNSFSIKEQVVRSGAPASGFAGRDASCILENQLTSCLRSYTETLVAAVPIIRIRDCNDAPVRKGGRYILYWMIASRRLAYNFALDRAVEYVRELQKPLVIFEALRCGYPWASERMHKFVLEGMADNAGVCRTHGVRYYPYVEARAGAGSGLLSALGAEACVVVTDEYPCFFLPSMVRAAAKKLFVRLESVDSNGLLPLHATERAFSTAYAFRRFLQNTLPAHLAEFPSAAPLQRVKASQPPFCIPNAVTSRWPVASAALLSGESAAIASLPIDHRVGPVSVSGGHANARARMKEFLNKRLPDYSEWHNEPDRDGASELSFYLHFGHIAVHEIFAELARREKWKPEKLALRANGRRAGWWNMNASAETFLDELITWREAGYNFCAHREDYARFESLPEWAQKTLQKHARDERAYLYSLEQFESAATHDVLWNAAQRQLVREGRIHSYLRMLWGKKILEWSASPRDAVATLIHLNNKYALDGRDANSYSGIFWCLGRYDRPWGPERPIFGTIRYMSSQNTVRKVSVKKYLQKYGRM
jgi:deoxyribodipyrimidine photo-lyase